MKFIITSGSTYSPIDDIRGITNKSKGTTGAKIAEEALLRGYNVDYISNKDSIKPFEIKINPLTDIENVKNLLINKNTYQNNLSLIEKNNFEDYINYCINLNFKKDEKVVFISTAAVSDYVTDKKTGKINSNLEKIDLSFYKTPKVIEEFKKKNPLVPVIGFKLLSSENSSIQDLIEISYQSLLRSRMSLIVANLVNKDFKIIKTLIITPEKHITILKDRNDLYKILINLIEDRLNEDFYSTKIIKKLPEEIDLKDFKSLIKECNNFSLFTPYGEGRKDADFGAIAIRNKHGILTTGRGTSKSAISEDNVTLIKNINKNIIEVFSNNIKPTLNASTLWHIMESRKDINYIIHAHVYLSNGLFIKEESAPSTFRDYEIIKHAIENGENVINQFGHGCFILLKNKDDLFEILSQQNLYNSNYAKYYDMAYYRFKKGILENTLISLNLDKNLTVLDFSCGTGKSTLELIKMGFNNISISDDSKEMLNVAMKRTGKYGVTASFNNLDNIKEKYDLITIRQAFSYIKEKDIDYFVKNIIKKLNDNGLLIFNGFKKLNSGIIEREDYINEDNLILKTKETNIIENNRIIHSQRTEYMNLDDNEYIPLYDFNIFYQHDFYELSDIFSKNGFDVKIIENNKSICFIGVKK